MNSEAARKEESLFSYVLARLEQLNKELEDKTETIRMRVLQLNVGPEVSKNLLDPGNLANKAPETIIEKLNDLIYRLELKSSHLSVTLRMLDKII